MKAIHTTITLLLVLVCANLSLAQVQVSAWEIHRGNEGVVNFPTPNNEARIAAFEKASIPEKSDPKWALAKTSDDGTINYPNLGGDPVICAKQLDFTYFQTFVYIPKDAVLNEFKISYKDANDGARIIFFDKNGKQSFDPASDLILNQSKYVETNLSGKLVKGETNRIVIVQYNQCSGSSISGIRIKINQKEVAPAVLPTRFRLHAYSINGKRVDKGSNYWMGFDKNAKKVNAANNNAPYYEGNIVDPAKATVMEFERVDVDKEKGIIALRVVNSPIPNLYLQVGDDKMVTMYPGTPKSGRGHFYVRRPEEEGAGNLNFISLETAGFPSNGGWFLRHEHNVLKVTPGNENTRKDVVYRQDATWLFEPVN